MIELPKDVSFTKEQLSHGMARVVRLNLPTFVIGPMLGDGKVEERKADILKIWPSKESVRQLRPAFFNAEIDVLASTHCGE